LLVGGRKEKCACFSVKKDQYQYHFRKLPDTVDGYLVRQCNLSHRKGYAEKTNNISSWSEPQKVVITCLIPWSRSHPSNNRRAPGSYLLLPRKVDSIYLLRSTHKADVASSIALNRRFSEYLVCSQTAIVPVLSVPWHSTSQPQTFYHSTVRVQTPPHSTLSRRRRPFMLPDMEKC
jgi:hypothetical protein